MTATATSKAPARAGQPSGLGLEELGDLSALLAEPQVAVAGGPLELDLALIDEDPNQPRTTFDAESLAELADTIRERGVKTPISVRVNAQAPGRFVINHGARRVRASRLAGKATIPGFIDPDYTAADQVIENLQRDGLTAREIADFIGRELARGRKKGEIARAIGKSAAFVTQHVALLDLPEPIASAFNSGRCRDVTVVNELVTAHRKNPREVQTWLADEDQEITRGAVKLLREFLEDKRRQQADDDPDPQASGEAADSEPTEAAIAPASSRARSTNLDRFKRTVVQVRHRGQPARLVLNRRPRASGHAWLRYDDGQEIEADLSEVQLIALLEG